MIGFPLKLLGSCHVEESVLCSLRLVWYETARQIYHTQCVPQARLCHIHVLACYLLMYDGFNSSMFSRPVGMFIAECISARLK